MRDQSPFVDVVLRHGRAVTSDEECFVLRGLHEDAATPHTNQEVGNAKAHFGSQGLTVGLEDNPLGTSVDGPLDENDQPAYVNRKET
jgi:hypothetical protein